MSKKTYDVIYRKRRKVQSRKLCQNGLENKRDTEGRDSRLNNIKKNSIVERGKLGAGVVEFIPLVLLVHGLYSNVIVKVYFKVGHAL